MIVQVKHLEIIKEICKSIYGSTLHVHPSKMRDEYARGMIDGRFIVIRDMSEEPGEIAKVTCSDREFLKEFENNYINQLIVAGEFNKEIIDG